MARLTPMSERTRTAAAPSVPFLDLRPMHDGLAPAVLSELASVIAEGAFINGPQVARFERAFAAYCTTAHCVGMSSGLDALRLGLLAAEIESGTEVIVPANTFVATFEAVTQAGLVPVPVDVSESDYGLDPKAVESAVGSRTQAVLAVHLYGQLSNMRKLDAIARRSRLALVEDAAQAHGATRDGFHAGAVGLVAAFSFYPGKNLGAMGDAGALVTDDEALAEHARALREHGQRSKYVHELEGYRPGSTRSRRWLSCTSFRTSTAGTRNARRLRRRTERGSPASATFASPRPPTAPLRSGISTSSARPSRSVWRSSFANEASARDAITRFRLTSRSPMRRWAIERVLSRSASRWPESVSRCPCSPA